MTQKLFVLHILLSKENAGKSKMEPLSESIEKVYTVHQWVLISFVLCSYFSLDSEQAQGRLVKRYISSAE